MPDLFQTLRSTDLDFLNRLFRAWRSDLPVQEFSSALEGFQKLAGERELFDDVISSLPSRAAAAWAYLLQRRGKVSWAIFTRQFGELRTFGVAKRGREEPDLHPISATEELWYRGLIGRAFLDLPPEPQEYAYIPDEFLAFAAPDALATNRIELRPASALEKRAAFPASDAILDDMTEVLAALRMSRPVDDVFLSRPQGYRNFLFALLQETGLLTLPTNLDAVRLKDFLAMPRGEALLLLFKTWRDSKKINDLRLLPGLVFEGNWNNDPLTARELVLESIRDAGSKTWWSLNSFVTQVKDKRPDYQRPAGDYESWFIRDAETNEHMHGPAYWDRIDGALMTFLLTAPLHWLGVVDIARGDRVGPATGFRLSPLGEDLITGCVPVKCKIEDGIITVGSDGVLRVPLTVPRAIRYQAARFGDPMVGLTTERKYRVTPGSLREAAEQGLKVSHLLQLFQQAKTKNIPPSLVQQLERWEKYGSEATLEKVILLRLARPELLPLLQKNQRTSQCILAVLNNQNLLLKPGKVEQMRLGLAELGLLADVKIDSDV